MANNKGSMACNLDFVQFIVDQCSGAGEIAVKKMMGDYCIYCNGVLFGLICDNNLYIKQTDAGEAVLDEVVLRPPYPSARDHFYTLNGTLVPFILGISTTQPDSTTYVSGIFTAQQPLQMSIAYDNEMRNQAVNWMKENGYEISSYLGQPLLKLKNLRIVIKRVLKS